MSRIHLNKSCTRAVAVVTGSSRGIGAEIVKQLAKDNFAVVINYVNNNKEAEMVAESIILKGGKAITIKAGICEGEILLLMQ